MSDNKIQDKNKSRRSTRKSSAGKISFPQEDVNSSTILSSTVAANQFNNYEYNEEEYGEMEGEGKEFSSSSIHNHRQTLTDSEPVVQEKEFVEKLCRKIAENFWESAWNICAERFYNGNAPSSIALELRDTWLRIIESQYLDQDQPLLSDLPINMFVPDEPPPLLVSSSPSMDLLIQSHQRQVPGQDEEEKEAEISEAEKGQGDIMEEKKKKKKISKEIGRKNGKNGLLVKRKEDNFSKNGLRTKKLVGNKIDMKKNKKIGKDEITSSLETPASGQRAAPNTRDSLPSNEGDEEQGEVKELEVDEKTKAIEASGCVERPKFKLEEVEDKELPWEVIFMAKHRFDDSLSRSISQEYRSMGLEPWRPSQCPAQNSGAFQFINESSSFVKKPVDFLLQDQEKQSEKKSLAEPGVEKLETREQNSDDTTDKISHESAPPEKKEPTKEFSLKSASIVLDVPPEEKTKNNNNNDTTVEIVPKEATNIRERIDNLLHADSDHVVQILRPAEAGHMVANVSQEFDVHDTEFDEHFPKQPDANDRKNDEKINGERRISPNLKKNERKKSIKKNSLGTKIVKSTKPKSPRNSN